ncbi:MAG: DnaJ domain-containing protein [Clostridia bacterium]|nr:DnaJ domain-containing protein [Clostridia bacterium]
MKNYYDILEVSRKASKDTINKIFKLHMKANHPDLFHGEEKIKAEEKSKELTEAYNVLSDDIKRAKYDEELEVQENANSQIQQIINENEYLRQVIAEKDELISRFTNNGSPYANFNTYANNQNSFNTSNTNSYQEPITYGSGFNGFSPNRSTNPYEGMSLEELQKLKKEQTIMYYKEKFKEVSIKLLITTMLVVVVVICLISSFNDLAEILGN